MPKGNSGKLKNFKFASTHGRKGKSQEILPVYANIKIKNKTLEGAMEEFRKKHGKADHEWAYAVDNQGFVDRYVEGAKHSVSITATEPGQMILHNHPGGGAFSKPDLLNVANEKNITGVVATGSKGYEYVFKKGTHFAKHKDAFIKAVENGKIKGKDYDDAVHRWLTDNQKKYSYTYYRKKYK